MKFRTISALIAVVLLSGCSGEENAVRSAVREVFDAAKSGDIAQALDRMDAANPLSAILQHIREEQGEEAYDVALAELGARSRDVLEKMTLRIEAVEISGDQAIVYCVFAEEEREFQSRTVVSHIGGEWRPYSLPGLPANN